MNKTGIRNLAPKVISILFALLLWIYVMGAINPRVSPDSLNITVKLINLEELQQQGLVIVGDQEFKVRAKLTGRRDEVYKIGPEQIQIKADLRGCKLGVNSVPLEVIVPSNIEVDISPRFIRVELEEVIKKQREVKVVVTGTTKENYVAGDPEFKPTLVWIEGPESYVNSVENVVAKIDVTGEDKNLVLSLPLKPVNSRGEEITSVDVKTPYADVTLPIYLLKSVPIKPDLQITTAEGFTITIVDINPKEVILRGPEAILKDIKEIITEPIKAVGLNKSEQLETKVKLPEGIKMPEEVPIIVNVTIEKVDEETYQIDKEKISFINLNEKYKIDKSDIPETVGVRIIALRSVLDTIKDTDMSVIVDLNNLSAGQYTIEPVISLPFNIERDVKESHLDPKTISVKVVDKK